MNEDIELYAAFFQKSKFYYIEKLRSFQTGVKFFFNVYAFLFGVFWFMYRKMYLEVLIILVIRGIEELIENYLSPDDNPEGTGKVFSILSTLITGIVIGFLSNYLYLRKAEKMVRVAKEKYLSDEERKTFLLKKGGVSIVFLIVIIILALLIFVLNNYWSD